MKAFPHKKVKLCGKIKLPLFHKKNGILPQFLLLLDLPHGGSSCSPFTVGSSAPTGGSSTPGRSSTYVVGPRCRLEKLSWALCSSFPNPSRGSGVDLVSTLRNKTKKIQKNIKKKQKTKKNIKLKKKNKKKLYFLLYTLHKG